LEEKRIAEVIVEITRALSSSLNTDEVLFAIASRLRDVLDAEECSIVRVDPKTGAAQIMVKSSDPAHRNIDIDLAQHPELKQAYESQRLLFSPDAKPAGLIAVPMVAQESGLGLICIRSPKLGPALSESNARFFEVMAS